MKKLIFIILLFISYASFGQGVSAVTLQVKGGNGVNILPYNWTGKTSPDTLANLKYFRGNYLQLKNFVDSLNAHSSFFSNDFIGLGTSPNPIRLSTDTIGLGGFIVRGTTGLRKDTNHYVSTSSTLFEHVANKATTFAILNNTLYPTTKAVANRVDSVSKAKADSIASGFYLKLAPTASQTVNQAANTPLSLTGDNTHANWAIVGKTLGSGTHDAGILLQVASDVSSNASNLTMNSTTFLGSFNNSSNKQFIVDFTQGLVTDNIGHKGWTVSHVQNALATDSTLMMKRYIDSLHAALSSVYVPLTRTITINGVTLDLSVNRSWTVSGGGGSSLAPTAVKTANYTAAASDYVPVNTTSGGITITLPSAPADKTIIGVKHIIQGSTNTVTIAAAGSDVFNKTGGSTSLTLTILNQGVLLQYSSSSGIWYVTSDDLPLAGLDLRYASISTALTASNFVKNEVPSGTKNGTNVTFTLTNTPTTGTVEAYYNGVLLRPTTDYSMSGSTCTYTFAPISTDYLLFHYTK